MQAKDITIEKLSSEEAEELPFIDTLPVFFQPTWWNAAPGVGKWQCLIARKADVFLAYFPYSIKRKVIFNLIENPWITPYAGPFLFEENTMCSGPIIRKLFNELPSFSYVRLRLYPGQVFNQGKVSNIQQIIPGALKVNSELKNRFNKLRHIIDVEKEGVDPETGYGLIVKALQDKGVKLPFNKTAFVEMDSTLRKSGVLSSYTARDRSGNIVGVHYTLEDDLSIYALISGVPRPPASTGTHNFIRYRVACEAAKRNKVYDLCGSTIVGVRNANMALGATDVQRIIINRWKI